MSAPSSSRLPTLLVALVAALVAAGCTIPGSSRLEGPPKDLPPSLSYVSADVLGFSLYDTDPESKLWAGLGAGRAEATLDALHARVFGDGAGDVDEWIGDSAGVAIRELQVGDTTEPATLYFADVSDPGRLELFLKEAGWVVAEDTGQEGPPQEWERATGPYRALAVDDGGLVAATDRTALERWIDDSDEYAVADRKAMREYAVEARERVPASFVFRGDLWRTQVRRPFEDDPATLEFARWATDSNTLVALRDGWLGVAPPLDRDAEDRVRIVGASEWVPDLAPDIELKPADRDALMELGPNLDWAVALHDPGQHLRELVRAITVGAGQYVTGEDVEDEDERVELLPVLDELDGAAAIGGAGTFVEAFVEGGDAQDVNRVLEVAELDGRATEDDGALRIEVGRRASFSGRGPGSELDDAGAPPRPPVLWIWSKGGGCLGPAAGWVTFDGTDELRMSVALELVGATACPDGLAAQTLADLGIPLREQPRSGLAHSSNSDG